jgi:ABC-type transport system substrate-binding protein
MLSWSIEYQPYPPTSFDPEKAKRLLAEAGYPKGFTIYLYSFKSALPELPIINEVVAGYWENIGLNVKILEMDYAAFRIIYSNHKDPAGPSAFLLDYPNRPVYSWRNNYSSTAMFSHVKDDKADAMITDIEKQIDLLGYISACRKLEDYVLSQGWSAGFCTTPGLLAMKKDIPKWGLGKGVSSYRWEYMGVD